MYLQKKYNKRHSFAAWAVMVRVPSQFGAEEAAGTGPTPIKQIRFL